MNTQLKVALGSFYCSESKTSDYQRKEGRTVRKTVSLKDIY